MVETTIGLKLWFESTVGLKHCFVNDSHFPITDAVIVTRYLKATLVIPSIRGSEPGDQRLLQQCKRGR
ncbi:hypothetical protein HanXRQr2_Chr02g0052911 [Helianthus annuus]|uniref:Uncharacterized protein n=1 Tax=Helianthus annuus TaxID=4232 RepID=A0A251VEE7_HELAN|nr:hypothetical protein HanXRQr2_Chr02g0052911 [Helianthus annuus]